MDIFPPASACPFRMEFMGDELESIREFDSVSQRSTGELADFMLLPAREVVLSDGRRKQAVENIKYRSNALELTRMVKTRLWETMEEDIVSSVNPLFLSLFYESLQENEEQGGGERLLWDASGTLFDYLPEDSMMILDNSVSIRRSEESIENEIERFLMKARNEGKFHLEKESSYLTGETWRRRCEVFQQVHLDELTLGAEEDDIKIQMAPALCLPREQGAPRDEEGIFRPVADKIVGLVQEGNLVVFLCAGQEEMSRMDHLLSQYDLSAGKGEAPFPTEINEQGRQGRLLLKSGRITAGFHLPDMKLVVVTD